MHSASVDVSSKASLWLLEFRTLDKFCTFLVGSEFRSVGSCLVQPELTDLVEMGWDAAWTVSISVVVHQVVGCLVDQNAFEGRWCESREECKSNDDFHFYAWELLVGGDVRCSMMFDEIGGLFYSTTWLLQRELSLKITARLSQKRRNFW